MYGQEIREEAQRLRRDGTKVQDVARVLAVSAGWASKATSGVKATARVGGLLSASKSALDEDGSANGAGRARRVGELSGRRVKSLSSRLSDLKRCVGSEDGQELPHWASEDYKAIDRAQQLFAKDEQHPLFGLMATDWPEMLEHLVQWKRVRRSPDRSESGFRETALRVHNYVMEMGRPPSISDRDPQVQQDAMWLWRWKCNANGRVARKRNLERAQVFTEIGIIVEMLRSPVPAVYGQGKELIENGRWTALFNLLMATGEVGSRLRWQRQ